MKTYQLILGALVSLIFASCNSSKTLVEQYPKMYEEEPLSIAVMPPINQTTHAEVKDYFYTTLYMPLCEKGYYVYSPYLTMEMFQSESAYDSEQFLEADLTQFHNVLGADAVIFTIVKEWTKQSVAGKMTAQVEYIIRSTKTGDTLYSREGKLTVSKSSGNNSLLGMIATAVATAVSDKIEAGRKCNTFVLSNLPVGKYHAKHGKDQKMPAGKTFIKGTVK